MPGTGTGGGAGPKHGIEIPESQLSREAATAEPAANTPVFRKARLSMTLLLAFRFLATVFVYSIGGAQR